MNIVQALLDEVRDPLGSSDYWDDEGCIIALSHLRKFEEHDWQELLAGVDSLQQAAKSRLADVLSDIKHPVAAQILSVIKG